MMYRFIEDAMIRKKLKNRFGTIAVNKGFITSAQLVDALTIQAQENVEQGTHRLIGQILLDQGLLTPTQVDDVLETMSNTMIYTLAAGR